MKEMEKEWLIEPLNCSAHNCNAYYSGALELDRFTKTMIIRMSYEI